MNRNVIVSLTALLVVASANAETVGASSASKAPTATEVRTQCRAEARAQGLKNEERVAAVDTCYAKVLPERAAALKCRHEGKAKGLAGSELRDFTRQCRGVAA